jgi:hypothetical protein
MSRLANALLSFLRAYRSPLLVIAIGMAALAFVANDARNQRLRAGISDECAHAQYAMKMFPMTRCFSIEEFVNMHRGDGGGGPGPRPNDRRSARSEERSSRDGGRCKTSAETQASAMSRPRAPDYVYGLLTGWDCAEADESSADEE